MLFHIHIGYDNPNIDSSLWMVKYLDMYLGLPSVIHDNDKRRRSLYGKAGCFRLTPYGVEYRVLSSAMMKDTETLTLVWNQLMKALEAYETEVCLIDYGSTVSAINNSNVELAKKLVDTFNIV